MNVKHVLLVAFVLLLTACGGGGGSGSSPTLPAPVQPQAVAPPSQFIARVYVEALGRAPTGAEFTAAESSFGGKCDQPTLTTFAQSILSSAEFTNLSYDANAKLLVLYRALLNREPDSAGFSANVGIDFTTLVTSFLNGSEFAGLVSGICAGDDSFEPNGKANAIAINGTTDATQLQNTLTAGMSVALPQESVVMVNATIDIPAGVTLSTAGTPNVAHHALQARLIRASGFSGPLVSLHSGSLKSVWVDGQRAKSDTYNQLAINVEIDGGSGVVVDNDFISNSLGWSNIHSYGSLDGAPCASNTITNNVVAAFSGTHKPNYATDGLSLGCENTTVTGNQIVDPTDVGIVVFTAYPAVQKSVVQNNVVISAGHSAYGAYAMDALTSDRNPSADFTGASIASNKFFSGQSTHFVIGLAVGSNPWFSNGVLGTGGSFTANTNDGVTTNVVAGIVVSGMLNATVQSNDLIVNLVTGISQCPNGDILASISAGKASGSIQSPFQDVAVVGCMSDSSN